VSAFDKTTSSEQLGAFPPSMPLGEYVLRPLRRGDAACWSSFLSESPVTLHTSWGAVDLPSIEALVEQLVQEYPTRVSCRFAIAEAKGDQLVGTCGFSTVSYLHGTAELVYDLAPSYWGRGIMRRAVEAVLQWAFSELGLQRVQAVVMTTNHPSIKVLERCGFAREGLLRNYRVAHGRPRDFYMYSRVPPEPQLRAGAV